MLKRLLLMLALIIGAFAMAPSSSQATPLGVAAQLATEAPVQVEKARYYRVRYYRPRRHHYRRYYAPRRHYYRRYYAPRRHYYRRYW